MMSAGMNTANSDIERLHAEQASAWLEALRHAGPRQRAEFVAWLKESPRNVRDMLFMLTLDDALAHIDSARVHDIQDLIAQVNRQVVPFPGRRDRRNPRLARPWPLRWAAMAAGLAIVLVSGWFVLSRGRTDWREYQTATSEQRAFELPDGSVVDLNTHSRIAVRLTAQSREVRLLKGEALFSVRHDASRPFRVYTGDAEIEDLGTQFDVYNRPDGTFIAVLEGSVHVLPVVHKATSPADALNSVRPAAIPPHAQAAPEGRSITANQEAQVTLVGMIMVRTVADVSDAVAWRDRRLVFRQESLGRIIQEFNRYNIRKIQLQGPSIASRTYTGVFDVDDIDSLAQLLARDGDLSVETTEQGIVVRQR